jgi:hypothetical protein
MQSLAFCFLLLGYFSFGQPLFGSAYYDNATQKWKVVNVYDTNAVAFGQFEDTLEDNGWGVLKVQTNSAFSDDLQMFGAGFLEGALTQDRIYQVNSLSRIFLTIL